MPFCLTYGKYYWLKASPRCSPQWIGCIARSPRENSCELGVLLLAGMVTVVELFTRGRAQPQARRGP